MKAKVVPKVAIYPSLTDRSERLSSGYTVKEVVNMASKWWDKTAHKIITTKEFKNPEVGFVSGITRALEWDMLSEREKINIILTYHHYHIVGNGTFQKTTGILRKIG